MSNTSDQGATSPISPLLRIDQVAELLGCSERHSPQSAPRGADAPAHCD
jgi:hypothetical protein